ncbi:putative ankyrin repeat-containing domain-containing protein [Helianthus annuus]|uniref:Ankyrin repeat-containing domain-containing protein n=1 Tax=Helianthus annuus TaxID=4232 RepID=A0A251V560_HELAN|nr:uncharacterized protein LOC110928758 [Helianthus annuus]KAF5812967.1 putative ankyrin repeat-containing domain-containing protein [Helianthus annuus]
METAGSSNALVVSAPSPELEFMLASNINVSSFVTEKLSGRSNYRIWSAQMRCFLMSQGLLCIVEKGLPLWKNKGNMEGEYECLVRCWIFSSVNEKVLKDLLEKHNSEYLETKVLWRKLYASYMPDDSDTEDVPAVLDFWQASNVNVSNFVSMKLSGCSNYNIWKAQMLCLIQSRELLHIIDAAYDFPGDKYDNLVKGWIFGSMNEKVLKVFVAFDSAAKVWKELESSFNSSISKPEDSPPFMFGKALLGDAPEIRNTSSFPRERLYEAVVEGCWWKAKSILKIHKKAATEAITTDGNTILHLAVEWGQNYFVEKLLEYIKDGKDIERQNDKGRTALQVAATVGNMYAAQLFVQKRKELLVIRDHDQKSPFYSAFYNLKLNVSAYLLSPLSSNSSLFQDASYQEYEVEIMNCYCNKRIW